MLSLAVTARLGQGEMAEVAKTAIDKANAKGDARRIEETLYAVDGVRSVTVEEGRVVVDHDEIVVDANRLRAAIVGRGTDDSGPLGPTTGGRSG
ncbi:hypothetical protein BH18ACT12_BH18ACT12_16950 [soil metagenome]